MALRPPNPRCPDGYPCDSPCTIFHVLCGKGELPAPAPGPMQVPLPVAIPVKAAPIPAGCQCPRCRTVPDWIEQETALLFGKPV